MTLSLTAGLSRKRVSPFVLCSHLLLLLSLFLPLSPLVTTLSFFTTLSFLSSRVLDGPGGPPKKMNMRPGPHVRRSEAEGSAVSLQVHNHPLLRASRAASMRLAAPSLLIASDK